MLICQKSRLYLSSGSATRQGRGRTFRSGKWTKAQGIHPTFSLTAAHPTHIKKDEPTLNDATAGLLEPRDTAFSYVALSGNSLILLWTARRAQPAGAARRRIWELDPYEYSRYL